MNLLYYWIALGVLILGVVFKLFFGRSIFTKHKYVRLVWYRDDMSEQVQYVKRKDFNKRHEILVNPRHIFNFNGYTSLVLTSKSNETINPLDFESKFNTEDYKSAIRSNLIKDAFQGLQVEKFDKIMLLIIINGVTLMGVAYMLYTMLGKK